MGTTEDERLDETFAALASSTRRALLARLAQGPATVNQLAEPFDLGLPAISKHVKVLERAGLVRRGRHAQFRPCELDPAPLREVSAWADLHRATWEASFDRMQHLATLQAARPSRPNSPRTTKKTNEENRHR
jgi:DNA-binding transcriptional ArsR family regulator